jgi:hypothetical protein
MDSEAAAEGYETLFSNWHTQAIYTPPINKEAHEIWTACGFRSMEPEFVINHTLLVWASANRCLKYSPNADSDEPPMIVWTSKHGTRYTSTWPIFQKWFAIACGRYQLAAGPTPDKN